MTFLERMKKPISCLAIATLVGQLLFIGATPALAAGVLQVGADKAYKTIQSAIDAAVSGNTIFVYPGEYTEKAADRTILEGTPDAGSTYQFGLFLPNNKPGLKIVGVDSLGTPLTDPNSASLPVVTTEATNNFGPSGIWVEGTNDTIQGIKIGANIGGNNKTIEVIADNFTLQYSQTSVFDGGGSIYVNDFTPAGNVIKSYHILNNIFPDGTSVDLANGAGLTGPVSGREILNNSFNLQDNGYNAISFNGTSNVAWFTLPVGGAIIKGNNFSNSSQFIRARGVYDNSQFNWKAYWYDNTFDKAVVSVKDATTFDVQDYSYNVFTNVRRISTSIQEELANASEGNTLLVAKGNYVLDSQIRINKSINIVGAGDSTVITKGSLPWVNATGSKGYAPIITVAGVSKPVKLEGFKVTGAKNIVMSPSGNDFGSGINIVSSAQVTLNNITSSGNAAVGLIVNSSNVMANNFNTRQNGWNAGVNIDRADSGDATFTLKGDGVISEVTKIYSDKTLGATVVASGYQSYLSGGKTIWTNILPEAPISLTPSNGSYTTNPAFDNTWAKVAGAAKYEYQVSNSVNNGVLGLIVFSDDSSATNYDSSDTQITRHNNAGTPQGDYFWQVRAINPNGVVGSWSEVSKVTVDTTTPVLTITSPVANQLINGRTITVSGTATDDNFNYYYCYVSNINGHEYGTRDASCTTTWHSVGDASLLGNVTLANDFADGSYVVHLIALDKAKNISETTQLFILDNTAPTTPELNSPADNTLLATNSFDFNWAPAVDETSVTYEYQSSMSSVSVNGVLTTGLWNSAIDGNPEQRVLNNPTIHSVGAPDGTWYWQVRAIDAVGNMSPWSAIWQVTLDTLAPVAIITSPLTNQISGPVLNIQGTASDLNFNYYYCYVTDSHGEVGIRDAKCVTAWSANSPFHSAFAQTNTGTNSGLLGSVDLTGLENGTYQVHLVAYDKAGNLTEAASVSFELLNPLPIVTPEPVPTPELVTPVESATIVAPVLAATVVAPVVPVEPAAVLGAQIVGEQKAPVQISDQEQEVKGSTDAPKADSSFFSKFLGYRAFGLNSWMWLLLVIIAFSGYWYLSPVLRKKK